MSKEGKQIPSERNMDRWVQHFEELMNSQPQPHPPEIELALQGLNINGEISSEEEIKIAFKQQKVERL